jgi:hypothetical protein
MKRLVVSQTSTRILHKRAPPALPVQESLVTRRSLRDPLGGHVLFKVACGELDQAVGLLYIIWNMPFNVMSITAFFDCFQSVVCHVYGRKDPSDCDLR